MEEVQVSDGDLESGKISGFCKSLLLQSFLFRLGGKVFCGLAGFGFAVQNALSVDGQAAGIVFLQAEQAVSVPDGRAEPGLAIQKTGCQLADDLFSGVLRRSMGIAYRPVQSLSQTGGMAHLVEDGGIVVIQRLEQVEIWNESDIAGDLVYRISIVDLDIDIRFLDELFRFAVCVRHGFGWNSAGSGLWSIQIFGFPPWAFIFGWMFHLMDDLLADLVHDRVSFRQVEPVVAPEGIGVF